MHMKRELDAPDAGQVVGERERTCRYGLCCTMQHFICRPCGRSLKALEEPESEELCDSVTITIYVEDTLDVSMDGWTWWFSNDKPGSCHASLSLGNHHGV